MKSIAKSPFQLALVLVLVLTLTACGLLRPRPQQQDAATSQTVAPFSTVRPGSAFAQGWKPAALPKFRKLTQIPIVIYYGDNIPDQPSTNPGQEQWRVFREVARRWRDAVNRHGGDVTLVELPSVGIRGNTHFPMSDLNNQEIAQHMASWLQKTGLE